MADKKFDWKKAFIKNRKDIVKGLANPNDVAAELLSYKIFNEDMYQQVVQIDETEQKTREILNTLDKRGEKGVALLHKAFLETSNEKLAKLLAPYVKAVEKRENKSEPKKWPPEDEEQSEMLRDPVSKIKDPKSPWFIHEYGKEYVYTIQRQCRGKVFIINNVDFRSKAFKRRVGSDKDAKNLTDLFKDLHFTVEQKDNLTGDEMQSFLMDEAAKIEKDNCIECVILIIMSHGGGTRIYGVDGVPVELTTLTDYFSSSNCPYLHGKPRLVFVQACRSAEKYWIDKTMYSVNLGGKAEIECKVNASEPIKEVVWEKSIKENRTEYTCIKERPEKYSLQNTQNTKTLTVKNVTKHDEGNYRCVIKFASKYTTSNPSVLHVKDDDVSDVSQKMAKLKTGSNDELDSKPSHKETEKDVPPECTIHDHPSADFLIAYATPEGTKAWLNIYVGSWFMNAIVWTFKYHAHEEELHHLLIRVNRLVGRASTEDHAMTVAEVKSNLRKKFYFFPGIYDDPPKLFETS